MPGAIPTKIVPAALGITAVAVFATAAASMYSLAMTPAGKYTRLSSLAERTSRYVRLSSLTEQTSQAGKPDVHAYRGSPLAPPARAAAETRGAAEKMFPNGLTKDFGAVPPGTKLLHRFPVSNLHAVPVTIAYLQPSCCCLTATAAQRTLQPGESTTIEVRMDAGDFTGLNTQNVRVKIVGPDFVSTCKLVVSAVSQAEIRPR